MRLPAGHNFRVMLYPGSDCIDNRTASAADVTLRPLNFSTTGASTSSTIVSLPIQKVQSNYVVDVREATSRAAVSEACARLNH